MTEVFLLSAARTPIGAFSGALAEVAAPDLGARCVEAAIARATVSASDVDEVILGQVLAAGVGQNPARQAAFRAGLSADVGATTINKVCGSGLKAVMLAAQSIRLGEARVVVAGGMESMSQTPYLLPKARTGYRLGHGQLVDSLIQDGLWDVYGQRSMGVYGDRCATHCGLTRQDQDDFAVRSYQRARAALASGAFHDELVPVTVPGRKQTVTVTDDEEPAKFDEAKLRGLRPAFDSQGTVTAGNASSINDGAAALVVASAAIVRERGWRPLARLVAAATHSREPEWFTLAPIDAIRRLFERTGWNVETTDLFEVNEAFAAVALAAERELRIPDEKMNVHGGAVALGHPIGASGARILVTLLHALRRTGKRRGIAALCIGGGEAVAVAVERTE